MEDYDLEEEFLMKIIMVGDSGVGKTNLLERYIKNEFWEATRNTVGVDFMAKKVMIHNQQVKIQFWDTAGQEKYKSISSAYYKSTQGVILVYDVTNRNSFRNIGMWLTDIRNHSDNSIHFLLVGNKIDIADNRVITQEEASRYARKEGLFFMEVSAKSNVNQCVNKAFHILFEEILKRFFDTDKRMEKDSLRSDLSKQRKPRDKLIRNSKILEPIEEKGLKKNSGCCSV